MARITMVGINDSTSSPLTQDIKETISEIHFIDQFPILSDGWNESDIHSIGLSYYTILGSNLGYTSFVDGRIFDRELRRLTDQDTRKTTAPIADSVWLDEDDHTISCAVEFQKMTSVSKISEKIENMVRYDEICRSIETLVLHYWDTQRQDLPRRALSAFEDGFTTDNGTVLDPPSADVLVYESVFSATEDGEFVIDTIRLAHDY